MDAFRTLALGAFYLMAGAGALLIGVRYWFGDRGQYEYLAELRRANDIQERSVRLREIEHESDNEYRNDDRSY